MSDGMKATREERGAKGTQQWGGRGWIRSKRERALNMGRERKPPKEMASQEGGRFEGSKERKGGSCFDVRFCLVGRFEYS